MQEANSKSLMAISLAPKFVATNFKPPQQQIMQQFYLLIFFYLCTVLALGAQPVGMAAYPNKKGLRAIALGEGKLKIDGRLDEAAWQGAPIAEGFTEYEPAPNTPGSFRTEVRVIYGPSAIYIGAYMYDPAPDSILQQLAVRDEVSGSNADYFTVYIDGMFRQQNAFHFTVSASGVREDASDGDQLWDAAWRSGHQILEDGWSVEIEIPYSQLRFAPQEQQLWGINFERYIRRYRESAYWSALDPEIDGEVQQFGLLYGLEGINPPLRLSLTPYAASYLTLENGQAPNFRASAGADLKYGINESFTLDVALIPDFGDVQSDNLQFNLSPFEIYYTERRPFFTEGTELFGRADLFYSRRVGSRPSRASWASSQMDSTETLVSNPERSQLINALKLSGRTQKGLGVGVFNAVTAPAYAKIESEKGEERSIKTESLSNYNLLVIDQQLRNNSYISFVQSSVLRSGGFTDAMAWGTEFRLTDKKNRYVLSGSGAYSRRYLDQELYKEEIEDGFKAYLNFGKIQGQWRWSVNQTVYSDQYNINDLGYIGRPNYLRTTANLDYYIFKPFGRYNYMHYNFSTYMEQLYKPYNFSRIEMNAQVSATDKNFLYSFFNLAFQPLGYVDFFEAREAGRAWNKPVWGRIRGYFSSDYRKPFALDGDISFRPFLSANPIWKNAYTFEMELSPRYRFNDRANLVLSQNLTLRNKNLGYVNRLADASIIFGQRSYQTMESQLTFNYLFSPLISLSFRARHFWASVAYSDFYVLDQTGDLLDSSYDALHDRNYNAFNIDLIFRWRFAPGSEFNAVWKNAILSEGEYVEENYGRNFQQMLEDNPLNQFSVKLLYFLDVPRFGKELAKRF